jgi:amino acid transporter
MFDVREWLKTINPILRNISNPHIFVIVKNGKGDVVLRYKHWSRDTEWKPSKDPNKGIVMLTAVCIFEILYSCGLLISYYCFCHLPLYMKYFKI